MPMKGIWKIPFQNQLDPSKSGVDICVVGIFGKTAWRESNRSFVIENLLKSYDQPLDGNKSKPVKKDENRENSLFEYMPKIEGYFDEENHILYLQLTSIYNATRLHEVVSAISEKDFSCSESHALVKSHEVGHIFGLVYLFSVCHLLILTHPVSQFDISYDRLFQRVASLRQKLVPVIKDVLKDCGVGRDWWVNARPCPPRLLLVFQRCHLHSLAHKQVDGDTKNSSEPGIVSKKKKSPVKRLQHTIEDQVYRILRNSRVLTNNAVNCLFSVPPNQAFVHIMADHEETRQSNNSTADMFQLLRASFKRHRDPHSTSRAKQLLLNTPTHWQEDYAMDEDEISEDYPEGSLKSFLYEHTALVLEKKGFNDSIGRNPLPSHVELPTLKTWLKVANGLYNLLLTDSNSLGPEFEGAGAVKKGTENGKTVLDLFSKVANMRQQLTSKIDIETKFSEARCGKVLPMAVAVYQSSLPPHYTSKVHNNQLAQALHTFNQHARGPAIEKYRDQLKSECVAFWQNGRQLCEVRSLTDRHCVHRYHILAALNEVQDPDADPPILHHSSRSRSTATSSCGTTQGMRDDPFDLKEGNYEFYVQLDKKAHIQPLEVYPFPVYHPGEESQGNVDVCYNTDGTASFSSQVIGTDQQDYRVTYSGLIQSSSIPTQDYECNAKEGRKAPEKARSLEHSENVAEATAEEFDNAVSTQDSYDGKDNADVSSQEISQGKPNVASVTSPMKSPKRDFVEAANSDLKKITIKEPIKSHVATSLNFAFSFGGQSEGSGRMQSPVDHDSQRESTADPITRNFAHIKEEKVNYVDGMIHSNCKKGALPLYPSWSLARVGTYSTYSAMRGLESPGFLPGTNFLIPWDIVVDKPREDMQQWPSPGEAPPGMGKKIIPQIKEQKTLLGRRNKDDSTARAFIGYEYETLRGQRFICSAPDKPVKVTSSGLVKESCHKLLENDMPLYSPSPASGRGGKTLIGQLMRVYVVIPPEPSIEVVINPQVVPGPSPTPTFTTGVPDILLSNDSVWVLRFPYVYYSDLGPHYIPKDGAILQMCKVLKGLVKLNLK